MKRIGPGGPRLMLFRTLFVRITVEKPDDMMNFLEAPPVVMPDPTFVITFHLMQRVNFMTLSEIRVIMSAKYRGNDERFREELLCHKYREGFRVSDNADLWYQSDQPVKLEIEDPYDIMPWLFPTMDLNEFFNQTKNENAEPLRLTEGDPKPGEPKRAGRRSIERGR